MHCTRPSFSLLFRLVAGNLGSYFCSEVIFLLLDSFTNFVTDHGNNFHILADFLSRISNILLYGNIAILYERLVQKAYFLQFLLDLSGRLR